VGRRERKRRKEAGRAAAPQRTSAYAGPDDSTLILRDELSPGTLRGLATLEARPAASEEDRWQRRVEYLFERLAVRWEIAGLPLEGQKELLGRFRLASAEERRHVREAMADHLRERYPEIDV
jgi:hypothetical protein